MPQAILELLTRRYDEQLFTLLTTNLTPEGIRKRYGDRIADRLSEMAVVIPFKNPSYRAANASLAECPKQPLGVFCKKYQCSTRRHYAVDRVYLSEGMK